MKTSSLNKEYFYSRVLLPVSDSPASSEELREDQTEELFDFARTQRLDAEFLDLFKRKRKCFPERLAARVSAYFKSRRVHLMRLEAAALEISEHLKSYGLRHFFFKGVALSNQIYSSSFVRSSGDIDLFIDARSLKDCFDALRTLGFHRSRETGASAQRHELKTQHAAEFERQDGIQLDVHWRIAQKQYALGGSEAFLWDCLTEVPVGQGKLTAPALESNIALLCLQSSKELWKPLAIRRDIYRALKHPAFEAAQFRRNELFRSNEILIQTAVRLSFQAFGEEAGFLESKSESRRIAEKIAGDDFSSPTELQMALRQIELRPGKKKTGIHIPEIVPAT